MLARVLTALSIAVLLPAATLAAPLAPTKASDLVVAGTSASAPDCPVAGRAFDVRFLPDGTQVPFVIPPNRVLVITSVDFSLTSSSPNQTAIPVVSLQSGATALPLLQGSALTDGLGTAAGTMVASAGVPVRSGPTLCVIGGFTPYGVLHGFFAKDK
jgi:hypothetical protein